MKSDENKDGILIVGGDSTIGNFLYKSYKNIGMNVFKTSRRKMNSNDIYLDLESEYININLSNIKKVFFCAAITSVEKCEKDHLKTYEINVKKTKELIQYMIDKKVFIIFLSTSLVYSGDEGYQNEKNNLQPKCEYGKQKLLIENFLKNYENSFCIIRFSKILHNNLLLFNKWISDLKMGENIYAFKDMLFSPINIEYAAYCLRKIEEINFQGIINISAIDEISYYDAAKYFASKLNLDNTKIIPISFNEKNVNNYQKHTTFDLTKLSLIGIPLQSSYFSLEHLLKNGE